MKKIYLAVLITFTIWGARLPTLGIPGVGKISPITILCLLTAIYIMCYMVRKKKIMVNKMQKRTIFLVIISIISIAFSTIIYKLNIYGCVYYFTSFCILIVISFFVEDKELHNFCEKIFFINVLIVLLLSMYEIFTGNYIILKYESYRYQRSMFGLYKPTATFYNINNLATFLVLATPICCNVINNSNNNKKIKKVCFLFINIFVIASTNSRAAIIAIALFLILELRNNKSKLKKIISISLLSIGVLVLLIGNSYYPKNNEFVNEIEDEPRIDIWRETLKTMDKYHFVGIGPGNISDANMGRDDYYYTFGVPHNYFLEFWAEFGIIAVVLFICLIFENAYICIKISRKSNDENIVKINCENYIIFYALFVIMSICPSTMMTANYLWLILGLSISMTSVYMKGNEECLEQINH